MITVGSGEFTYRVVEGWGKLPNGWNFKQVAGVVVDSNDNVYVYNRSEHHVIVFDSNGNFLYSWGENMFASAHGLWIDNNDYLYFADHQSHTIKKCTLDGKLLMTLGTENVKGDIGEPFRSPTGVSIAPSGDIFVSDGYDNARVHRFSPQGEHILSWGEKGDGEGQFAVPHGIFVHRDGIVYVADRENHRIQLFTLDGEFITQWKSDFNMPCTLYIDKDDIVYVPELRHRISILDINGNLLTRWGGVESHEIGQFVAPHTAWTDSKGDLYVGEVLEGQRIQKFERLK